MDRKTREELSQLSTQVFGSSSKWQKFVEDGEMVPVMETVKVLDGATKETKEEQRQVMHMGKNGAEVPKFEIKHYTAETIRERMITIKTQKKQVQALIEKLQKEEADKKAAIEVVAAQSGSANRA